MTKPVTSNDLRVRRTRKSLREAYIKLAGQNKRAEITVTALTCEAMINRKTFYHHYESLDDVLMDVERHISEKIIKTILTTGGGYRFK